MYRVLLRNVLTGKKQWFDHCFTPKKMERGALIFWKGPDDEMRTKYKIISWKWEGKQPPFISGLAKHQLVQKEVDRILRSFNNNELHSILNDLDNGVFK